MASGLTLVPQLLLFASLLLGVAHSVSDERDASTESIDTVEGGTPVASLISRANQYVADESLAKKRRLTAKNPPLGSALWTTPLADALPGSYLMEVSVGTPPQTFLAVADTGSDFTWLPCASKPLKFSFPCYICVQLLTGIDCANCSTNTTYIPTKSSTFATLPCSSTVCASFKTPLTSDCGPSADCDLNLEYGQLSTIQGTIVQDTLTIQTQGGNQTVTDFLFGCSNFVVGDAAIVSQGRVGLGRGTISWPSQLGIYFGDSGNKFGYCLVNRSLSSTGEVYSSPLVFGPEAIPVTSANGSQSLQYTQMITNYIYPSYYYVGCDGISLNGTSIRYTSFNISPDGSGGLIFDSGTLYTILESGIYESFISVLITQITKYQPVQQEQPGSLPLCYNVTWSDWVSDYGQAVPNISFQISNTSGFNLSAETAWVQQNGLTCLAMMPQIAEHYSISRIGNYQQVGYQMLFDLENAQIAFVPANCTGTIFPGIPPNNIENNGGTSLVSRLASPLWLLLISLLVLKHLSLC